MEGLNGGDVEIWLFLEKSENWGLNYSFSYDIMMLIDREMTAKMQGIL